MCDFGSWQEISKNLVEQASLVLRTRSDMAHVVSCPAGRRGRGGVTMSEVRQHRKLDDAWTVVRGKVYDITPYMRYHPGGKLISSCRYKVLLFTTLQYCEVQYSTVHLAATRLSSSFQYSSVLVCVFVCYWPWAFPMANPRGT